MAQSNSGIGNVIPNKDLVQIAMSYARSRMLCAARAPRSGRCTRRRQLSWETVKLTIKRAFRHLDGP